MKKLIVKPIPVPNGYKHPVPPNDVLPKHEFTMGLIAPKGAGKTTVICNLLNFYKGYFHTIIIFSPTIDSDEKWDWVKEQNFLGENKQLKTVLRDLSNKQVENKVMQGIGLEDQLQGLVHDENREKFSATIPADHFFNDYEEDKFREIMDEQMQLIRVLKKHDLPKYLANRILIVFDDLVGSRLFSGERGSYFKGVNTRHRHYSTSFLMVSQGYKEVPKTIRTNWTCLIVFEIGNFKELQVIYEEFPMSLNFENWMEAFKYATTEDHSFMFINFQKPKRLRMMKNFTQIIFNKED